MSLAAACVFIGACATTVPAPQAGESSLIVGTLKGHVIGNGTNTDGADGMMNTERPYILGIAIRSETTGRTYQFHAERGDGLFLLANAEPGLYRVTQIWAAVETTNTYINVTTKFVDGPSFEVSPGRVENLGVARWTFSYDLTSGSSANSLDLGKDYQDVEASLAKRDDKSLWVSWQRDDVAWTPGAAGTPIVVPERPRDNASGMK